LLVIRKSINNRYFKIKAEEEKKKAKLFHLRLKEDVRAEASDLETPQLLF